MCERLPRKRLLPGRKADARDIDDTIPRNIDGRGVNVRYLEMRGPGTDTGEIGTRHDCARFRLLGI
jgi:hypothetical protein